MKIIALQGDGEKGKTTTLKKLYVKIFNEFENVEPLYIRPQRYEKDEVEAQLKKEKEARKRGERVRIYNVTAILKVKGKSIGIVSAGDNSKPMKDAIKHLLDYNCELCFCAVRFRNSSLDYLNELSSQGHNVIFERKTIARSADKIDETNDKQAEQLLNMLKNELQ